MYCGPTLHLPPKGHREDMEVQVETPPFGNPGCHEAVGLASAGLLVPSAAHAAEQVSFSAALYYPQKK